MPRPPDSLTTYDLLHTPGIYAGVTAYDHGTVVIVAARLVGITTAKDGSTSPMFRARVSSDYDERKF